MLGADGAPFAQPRSIRDHRARLPAETQRGAGLIENHITQAHMFAGRHRLDNLNALGQADAQGGNSDAAACRHDELAPDGVAPFAIKPIAPRATTDAKGGKIESAASPMPPSGSPI